MQYQKNINFRSSSFLDIGRCAFNLSNNIYENLLNLLLSVIVYSEVCHLIESVPK